MNKKSTNTDVRGHDADVQQLYYTSTIQFWSDSVTITERRTYTLYGQNIPVNIVKQVMK